MSAEFPWESWFHREHAVAGALLTENYLLRKQVEDLKASAVPEEIAEVVINLRILAGEESFWTDTATRAADLLEQLARK